MPSRANIVHSLGGRSRRFSLPLAYLLIFFCIVLSHISLLHLPYFWDEGGYYVPAALDFYRTGSLIPVFTNAHPPFPSVILGTLWHVFGLGIPVTRVAACAFAALGVTAVFTLGRHLIGAAGGFFLALLTAVYPIWFAQSSLAHADIFAAGFTLVALTLYLTSPELIGSATEHFSTKRRLVCTSILFCLAVLSKETAVVQPATLAVFALYLGYRDRAHQDRRQAHGSWIIPLTIPIPVLAGWFAYHYLKTGQIFGNPVYLRYNATDNFTAAHVLYALRIRFVHLFWQRNIWLPLALAATCLLLPSRKREGSFGPQILGLPRAVTLAIAFLVIANLFAFSLFGGALLTRYLLPVYPLLLLICIAVWRDHLAQWPWIGVLTGAAFLLALWVNPSTFFAPEDNLTYRNMILVHQEAIDVLNQHYPDATVLTAWPEAADLFRPELGYTPRPFHVTSIENFSLAELAKAAQKPGGYDTALVFTTHYTSPGFRADLLKHPGSWRGRRYAADIDLSPSQIARILGGEVVWQNDIYGEWAAVLRFHRTYDASLKHTEPCQNQPGSTPDGLVAPSCFR